MYWFLFCQIFDIPTPKEADEIIEELEVESKKVA